MTLMLDTSIDSAIAIDEHHNPPFILGHVFKHDPLAGRWSLESADISIRAGGKSAIDFNNSIHESENPIKPGKHSSKTPSLT